MSEPLVIIGNGMAAARLVEELAARALGRYAIAVIGDEPQLAYNRVLLSSVLAGEIALAGDRTEARELVARPRRHAAATVAPRPRSTASRRVMLADGGTRPYSASSCSRPARSRSG